ncbi:MAG: AAA family ATPase [Gordonia sp. (in: high G+C Gram-positive bacteria)]|uniref:ATP-binding protein n=1 Tax=Gordonia sp. (in: high G+C Gram-positive bacteria) TaxID=84139 RepID=UPI0039E6C26C
MPAPFPFTAIVGQDDFKRALLLCAVDPGIGGVLAMGDRGTAKSTLVRSLSALFDLAGVDTPVVDLPLGATEDRVAGSLDVEAMLRDGTTRFRPGLLADAHGGFLYIDEVNLLDDFLVDLLLDVAASGVNLVERDGLSHSHPARFVLVGSGNPEEGRLRPQLEDRFGLSTVVTTIDDIAQRTAIVRHRIAFDADPEAFIAGHHDAQRELADRLRTARENVHRVDVPDRIVDVAVRLCVELDVVGHRGEVVVVRAARAAAALRGSAVVTSADLAHVAIPALAHRVERGAFESPATTVARVHNIAVALLGARRSA